MHSIDSKSGSESGHRHITLKQRLGDIITWTYEHTLDYPLVEDRAPNISKFRKRIRDRESLKIFSGYYNR